MLMHCDGGGAGDYSKADLIEFNEPFTISTRDSDEYLVAIIEPAVFDLTRSVLKLLRSKKSYQFPFDGVEVNSDGIITETPVAWLDWDQGKTIRWFIPEVKPEPPPLKDDSFGFDEGDGDVLA